MTDDTFAPADFDIEEELSSIIDEAATAQMGAQMGAERDDVKIFGLVMRLARAIEYVKLTAAVAPHILIAAPTSATVADA